MYLFLKGRGRTYNAIGLFDGKTLIVKKGSLISDTVSEKMNSSILKLRNDSSLVSKQNILLRDITFDSPSAAASFVTGFTSNGLIKWRDSDKRILKSLQLNKHKYNIQNLNPKKYTLFYNFNGELWGGINSSKSVSYLKVKIKAHRDEMVELVYNDIGNYCIKNSNKEIIFTQSFQKDERGNSNVPYHVETQKPPIKYKKAYLYDKQGDIIVEKRTDVFAIIIFDVICNDTGEIVTDLKFLKSLSDFIIYKRIPVMVKSKAQVSMATYFPQTKEEFVKLPGCGEKMYGKCGEMIMDFIKLYLDGKSE